MNIYVFAIFDKKAGSFQAPFTAVSSGVAQRMLREEMLEDRSMFSRYSDDFTLTILGSFDCISGLFDTQPPNDVCELSTLVGARSDFLRDI